MIRQAVRGLVLLAAVATLVDIAAAQTGADKVYVRDKKDGSVKTVEGFLKFGPAGLQVVSGDKGDKITPVNPGDIVKVTPGELPGVERSVVLAQLTNEEKKTKEAYATARAAYADLLKKAAAAPERSKVYLEYKLALMVTKLADESADDEKWSEQATEAVAGWSNFLSTYKTWEVWPATRTAARLNAELGKFDAAARDWTRLTKADSPLPPDLKLEASIQEIDANIRSGKGYANAQSSATALLAKTPPGAAKDRLAIYEAAAKGVSSGVTADSVKAAVKDIEEKIAATRDPLVRAVGYGMIGELYLANAQPRDAMWAFLWVETVYNQDKDEVLKAMVRLEKSFRDQMDDDRAKGYREKIRRYRSLF